MTIDDEARWKAQLHATWQTPAAVIDACVREASGAAVGRRRRIIGGEGNEVWDVITASGDALIVRISHTTTFAAERWATKQARRAGAPAPEVLFVDDAVDIGEKQVAVWVHRKIEGQPLGEIRDEQRTRRLTADAGEELARIHLVRTGGCGPIDGRGEGACDDFSDYLVWNDGAADAAFAFGIERRDVDHAAESIAQHRTLWTAPPCLLHGDWLPEHLIAHDERIVGVIDFGNTRSGDPAYDIAYWSFFWDADRYPSACLLDGYRRVSDVGPHFERRFHLCRLWLSMRAVAYYASGDRAFAAQHAARRFTEALAWLKAHG